jgi:hypothetical protein
MKQSEAFKNFLEMDSMKMPATQMKQVSIAMTSSSAAITLNGASFDKYTGPWGFEEVSHLFRRATYGMTFQQIKDAEAMNLDEVLDLIFEDQDPATPPINYDFEEDGSVPVGETWVDEPYSLSNINQILNYRRRSLTGWTFGQILNGSHSIREKMTLFWHNHFVIQESIIRDPKFIYKYITLLRNNATGNFRQLVKDVTIDPAMLRYLNGNQNTKNAPNENYARELLELFTVGKGQLAGPGDYTTFTENDVVEIAKILTGWRDQAYLDVLGLEVKANFRTNQHDNTDKQLSHRFEGAIIQANGADEYKDLIDVIFMQDEVSRYICRKLYRWFVYYKIDDQIDQNIIEPMAEILRNNDYEIEPALRALLSSEHFFDICNQGPMIKNPLDYLAAPLRQFDVKFPEEPAPQYNGWGGLLRALPFLQMQYYEPPNVAGWKAYYQEPSYYRLWVNSVTLPIMVLYSDILVNFGFNPGDTPDTLIFINILEYIKTLNDPANPKALIDDLSSVIYPQPLTQGQKNYLKSVLIPGLPDFEWTVEYTNHLTNPDDDLLRNAVDSKLRSLLIAMMRLPEFYLS